MSASAPLVSALMPAYNSAAFIGESLQSVLAQTYRPLEVIVVDDGSTDDTGAIASSFDEVTVILGEHQGPAAARNRAFAESHGDFVTAFDSDDLWPADRLTVQVDYLLEHPEIACVLGRQEWLNPPPWLGRDPVFGDLDGIPLGSAMFRRAALEALGGYDESFSHSEDMDLLVRTRTQGFEIAILPRVVWYRRFHGGQTTAAAPAVPPLLRSLRDKLRREQEARATAGGDSS